MNSPAIDLPSYFQQLYTGDGDPWQVRRRWYERRKRALILASLPQERYINAYEPGCGNGELTAQLAKRCVRLLAADLSEEAVALTRARLRDAEDGGCAHVSVEQHSLPHDWPRQSNNTFDLILISEFAYYLQSGALAALVAHCAATLAPGGTLLLCHWRAPFAERVLSTEAVHAAFLASPGLRTLAHHEEDDFLLDVWMAGGLSVAAQEGLR